jgi:hypothetical protein
VLKLSETWCSRWSTGSAGRATTPTWR